MIKEIRNFKGYYVNEKGIIFNSKHKKISAKINSNGYYYVILNNRFYSIDFIVAKEFIPNPDDCILVRHKDNNKLNNCVENLEWYDLVEKDKEPTRNSLIGKKVIEYDLDGNVVNEYEDVFDCEKKTNIKYSCIYQCCNKVTKATKDNRIFLYEGEQFVKREIKNIRKIYQINPDTKKVVKVFNSISEIKKYLNRKDKSVNTNISKSARHDYIFNGYLWKYEPPKPIKKKRGIKKANEILMIDKKTNQIIKEFKDYKEAMKELNLSRDSIRSYMTGRRGMNKDFKLIFKKENN